MKYSRLEEFESLFNFSGCTFITLINNNRIFKYSFLIQCYQGGAARVDFKS